jgi:threonine/homoserine/homoserine lactone efflux protein
MLLFVLASLALVATPGPNVLYVLARSMAQGRAAGLASVAGVSTGNLVHAVAAAAGLSAVLASSALAFAVVKYLGAAYLISLGLRKLLTVPAPASVAFRPESPGSIYRQGVFIGVLNPKVALFFLSFLPQFVDPRHGSPTLQFLMYGIAFVLLAALGDSLWAVGSGHLGGWIQRRGAFQRHERYVTGGVYCALGLLAATSAPVKSS